MQEDTRHYWNRPCAAPGLLSYRYVHRHGCVMIGAANDYGALQEARRSMTGPVSMDNLEKWNGQRYIPVPLS